MKRNLLLLVAVTLITLSVALGGIRFLAPELLGISTDLQLVQIDTKVPPFFNNIFRTEDYVSDELILSDPVTKHRAKPKFADHEYFGPHDLLGFRNRSIPNHAEVVVIGDSMTYGNNAPIDMNLPGHLKLLLGNQINQIYNMSVGGWGGIQYFDMFRFAMSFSPKVVIVAYHSGNDPLDSLSMAYGNKIWKQFVSQPNLDHADLPPGIFPPPEDTWWKVNFRDGTETVFTPQIRLKANANHPTIDAAWEIMQKTATEISAAARRNNITVLFTVIPTKELVYAKKIMGENITAPTDYRELVANEQRRIDKFSLTIELQEHSQYVDVVKPLQQQALTSEQLYPKNINGHPIALGYKVISEAIATAVRPMLENLPTGLYLVTYPNDNQKLVIIRDGRYWVFKNIDTALDNGWSSSKSILNKPPAVLSNLTYGGIIDEISPQQYGPLLE